MCRTKTGSETILIYFSGGGDETLPNFRKGKHPRKGEKKETSSKDQSPGKQTAQKRRATRRKGNH
jgi:hypothetical protein